MDEKYFINLIKNIPIGYSYQKILLNEKGIPYDFLFLDVNLAYEEYIGLKKADIIGKTALEILPDNLTSDINLIEFYGDIALSQGKGSYIQFSTSSSLAYKVSVYSPEKYYIVTCINECSKEFNKEGTFKERDSIFHNLIKNAPIPIMIHAEDGQVIEISDTWTEISGYTHKDIPTIKAWTKNAYGSKQDEVISVINELHDKKAKKHDGEYFIKTKDGSECLWDFYSTYLGELPDGRKLAMSVALDITKSNAEEKKVEGLVKDLQNIKHILEISLDSPENIIIISLDKDYKYLYYNKTHELSMKNAYNTEIKLGDCILDFMTSDEDIKKIKSNYDIALSGKSHTTLQEFGDLEKNYFETKFNPIYDLDGSVRGLTVFASNVTKRINTENSILLNEKRYRELVDNLDVGVVVHSPDTSIIMSNKKASNLLRISQNKLNGMFSIDPAFNFVDEEGKKIVPEQYPVNLIRNNGKPIKEQIYGIQHSGMKEITWVSVNGIPIIDKDGKLVEIVVSFKDITKSKKFETELLQSHNLMSYVIKHDPSAVVVFDNDLNCLYRSKKNLSRQDFKTTDYIGKHIYSIFPDLPQKWKDAHQKALMGETIKFEKDSFYSEDGKLQWSKWQCRPWYKSDKSIGGIVVYNEIITDRVQLLENLKRSEKNLKLAQNIAKVGSWELSLSTNKIWASVVAFEIYELDRTDGYISLSYIQSMVDENDREILNKALEELINQNKPYNVIFKIMTSKGNVKYINSRADLQVDDNNIPIKVIGVIHDITLLKEKELELEFSAYHDFLTGLHNRRYYEEKLEKLDSKEYYPLTVVMADINGLKLINDAFGHTTGDELLKSAASLIADNCREGDVLARIGGDEFVIVMPNTRAKMAERIVNRINEKAKQVMTQSIPLSISFGLKSKTLESEDIQDVYRSAEDLMYREKLLEIPSMRSSAIETILNTLYEKDEKSEVHSRTVSLLSERLASAYGMSRQDVAEVKTAGLLHDIGKIIIPLTIINKYGKLTVQEYETIKNHCEIGFRILNSTQDMRGISNIVLNHHERWDGKGYPRGIEASEIPIKSRIIAIADAFDAMTSIRTYRTTISKEDALQELIDNSGTQFDPDLIEIFEMNFNKIVKI